MGWTIDREDTVRSMAVKLFVIVLTIPGFLYINAIWGRMILLFFNVLFLTQALLGIAANSPTFPFRIPTYARMAFSFGIVWIALPAYYLVNGENQLLKYLFFSISFLSTFLVLIACRYILVLTLTLNRLKRDFDSKRFPQHDPPYICIVTPSPFPQTLEVIIRELFKTICSWHSIGFHIAIQKTQKEMEEAVKLMQDSSITFLDKTRFAVFGIKTITKNIVLQFFPTAIVTLEDLEVFPVAFRDFVLINSSGTLVFSWRGPSAQIIPYFDNMSEMIETSPESFQKKIKGLIGNRCRDTIDAETTPQMKLHLCKGPVISLHPYEDKLEVARTAEHSSAVIGDEKYSWSVLNPKRAVTQVVPHLVNAGIPMAESDRRLDQEHRDTAALISEQGLAPIADAYLRFRLALSNVERFLCLIDCFESLIRYSVFALIMAPFERNSEYREMTMTKLSRPPLGEWVKLLRELVASINGSSAVDLCQIADYWRTPLAKAPKELIDLVNGTGLAWKSQMPRSHLEWLEWLTWLRNSTKGHGSLQDGVFKDVWHDFHEAFLEAVRGLSEITLQSQLLVETPGKEIISMRGWLRGSFRSSLLEKQVVGDCSAYPAWQLRHGSYRVAPFVLFDRLTCLTWNSGYAKRGMYIDYATGKLVEKIASTNRN